MCSCTSFEIHMLPFWATDTGSEGIVQQEHGWQNTCKTGRFWLHMWLYRENLISIFPGGGRGKEHPTQENNMPGSRISLATRYTGHASNNKNKKRRQRRPRINKSGQKIFNIDTEALVHAYSALYPGRVTAGVFTRFIVASFRPFHCP